MNKRCIWIIELLLWAIVVCAISFSLVFFKSSYEQKSNSYYLFFSDVDGLMKGSPVRLMGMQIGYIQSIKVFDDKVFVSFLVTKDDIKVPEHAAATVEFYGLGGSKSLEIIPADKVTSKKDDLIITKEPYRIQDFYDVQNNIARTLVKMTNSLSVMVSERDIQKTQQLIKVSPEVKKIDKELKNVNEIEEKIIEEHQKNVTIEENENASTND